MRALRGAASLRANSLENPNNPITGGRLLSEITNPGDLWSGESTDAKPMSIGTVMRCVQIISATVAGCPIRTFRPSDNSTVDVPALTSLRTGVTPFERQETAVAHVALRGNSFTRKVRTRDGRIKELLNIHPTRVKVEVDDGPDAAAVGMPWVKKFTIDGKIHLTEYDIMHVPGLSLDGITGVSVIEAARRMFNIAGSAEAVADRLYERGMLMSGFLSTDADLDAEKASILRDRWRAKLSGVDNAYEVAVLDKGTKFHQLSMSAADAQFLESRKFQTTEIARLMGVPGWMVNDQEKSTSWGTGMEQQFTSFVVITLKSYMQRFEQRYTRELLNPLAEKAEFKVEGLLRGDSKARAAFYASGIQHGWLVPNDVRLLEDMAPVPWGNEPYRPYNASAGDTPADDTQGEDDDAADDS